ncbi:MAG TPA: hypothetical protein VKD72_40085 [Gemmataceae bacterium]|nr:hypothetical protein [Gemmataceae bacterium]
MAKTGLQTTRMVLLTLSILGGAALLASGALAADQSGPQRQDAEVQKILDKYRSFRPGDKDLAIFQLDWVPTLKDARDKAAREKRPIFLVVVTNSFGNMYTGHC